MTPVRRVTRRVTSCVALGLAAIALVSACTTREAPSERERPVLQWPGAPEPPRIEYLDSFTNAADLGIEKGWLERLGAFVFGAEDLRIVRPMAIASAGSLLYVADPGVRGVHRFDLAARRHEVLRGPRGEPLPSPVGLAVGESGRVFVSDSALRQVFVIDPGQPSAAPLVLGAELRQPTGLTYDPGAGHLYVVDTGAHQVLAFDRQGSLVATIGKRGEGDGQFNYPTMIWRDAEGRILVTDSLNFRVQILDGQGRFLGKFGRGGDSSGDMARHKGVATDSAGHVYVVDGLLHAMQIFDRDGRLLLRVGAQGTQAGEFWLPTGIYIDAQDRIYVADSFNRRVQIFRYVGGPT